MHDGTNGVFLFLLAGACTVNGQVLKRRDGLAIEEIDNLELSMEQHSKLLVMEVPMAN